MVVRGLNGFIGLLNRTGAVRFLSGKKCKFVEWQCDALLQVKRQEPYPHNTVWVHVASLGEYRVAAPIMRSLKREGYFVLLTVFSPSGFETLNREFDLQGTADKLLFLPLDTPRNARHFVSGVHPVMAIFIISELWHNYVQQLKKAQVPTYLVSALVHKNSAATKWYGGMFRGILRNFTKILVLDTTSKRLLEQYGINNVEKTGDPLFDNALSVAAQPYHNAVIERFCKGNDVFVGGSISDQKDLRLISHVANANRDTKFIIVPHEISEEVLNEIKYSMNGWCLNYSECDETTDFTNVQVLVIDFMGSLAQIYRYCKYAYVGGGFTPYLHSIIEPTVYGLPVAFGPKIYRKNTPTEMIERHIGQRVSTGKELNRWFVRLKGNNAELERIRRSAVEYVRQNSGATNEILKNLCL